MRMALYDTAEIMLTKPLKGCSQLKSWGDADRQARRREQTKVGLAGRLAVIMHRMLAKQSLKAGQEARNSSGRSRRQPFSNSKCLRPDDGPH